MALRYRLLIMNRQMGPDRAAAVLRRLASEVESSDSPSLSGLRRRLAMVAAAMTGADPSEERAKRIAAEIVRLALDEIDVTTDLWGGQEGEDVDAAYEWSKKQTEEEKLESSLKLLKRKVDTFIQELTRGSDDKKPGSDDSGVVTSAP